MKLAIIGTDGLPARYGGFETFAMEVSPRIAQLGHEVLVVGSSRGRPASETLPKGVTVRNLPLSANGMASIPYDIVSFATVCRWADAVLLLGVSAGPFVPVMRRMTRGGNLLVNIDGLESRRAKWSRLGKRYLATAESLAIRGARHIIADNRGIAEIVDRSHGRKSTVIAYGNDHVLHIDDSECQRILEIQYGLIPNGYLLTVARIEPENNIEMMIRSIPRDYDVPYVILGNFTSSTYGLELIERYREDPLIRLVAATYDPMALAALRSGCRAYLHGHSVGGTNPSLVEILPYGRPTLCFDCSFNRYTLDSSGAFFATTADLSALIKAGSLERYTPPPALQTDPRYQWQAIAERYVALAFEE